jgi:Leucine-rich repeat (LRR) protein
VVGGMSSLEAKLGLVFGDFTPPFSASSVDAPAGPTILGTGGLFEAKSAAAVANSTVVHKKKQKSHVKSLFQQAVDFVAGPNADRSVLLNAFQKFPPLSAPAARKLFSALVATRSPLLDSVILSFLMESFKQDSVLKLYGSHMVDNEFVEDKIAHISNLLVLDLSKCIKVTNLDPIANKLAHSLRHLNLDRCKNLDDTSCASIGKMTNLVYLKISGTKISEETLKNIGQLTQITTLDVRCNLMLNSGLQHLSNLALEKLYITECKFSPESVDSIRNFAETLQVLEMSFVPHLDDEATGFLESMKNLQHLDISLTHSFGDLTLIRVASLPKLQKLIASKIDVPSVMAMEALGKNPSLTFLDLGKNDITDLTASKLNSLCALTTLYLPYTRISDDFFILAPEVFEKVEYLKLTGNQGLTNVGVERLCRSARNLKSLDIGSTHLTDPCLIHLSTLHKLEELRIWGASISENAMTQFTNQFGYIVDPSMRSTKGNYILLRNF